MISKAKTLCLAMIVVSIFAFGCSSDSKTLKFSPSSLKFEDVNIGDSRTIDLVITNKYGKDIIIDTMTLSGSSDYSITAGNVMPINMLKGAEHTVTIEFEPTTSGPLEAMLTITSDASTKPKELTLTGTGVAVARIKVTPDSFDYLKKLINKDHTKDFVIENVGTSTLDISNFLFSGLGASTFRVTAGNAPVQIQPGATHTVTVAFSAAAIGNYEADMQINHNAVNESNPYAISLKAEAIDVNPQITLSQPNPWDFGAVATTLPGVYVCEIENTGIDPLTVSSATLTTGAEFTIDYLEDSNGNIINFPQIIAVGAKIYLGVRFAPTSNTTFNDTLTFVHDGTNENTPWDISLTGSGRNEMTKQFVYTGSAQQWVVPAGVSVVKIECKGAEGGRGYMYNSGHITGKGGQATAKVPVTPGDTININVGGQGGNASSGTGGIGGFNGGANGFGYSSYGGGGGGGASDVRVGGTALADRKIVGAGGGGAAYNYSSGDNGGNGGGLTGQHGAANSNYSDAHAGSGGTQSAGGAGGVYSSWGNGDPGTLGSGGKGGGGSGGGGGGGYYGGGGGVWSGGGGGSSYYDAAGNTDKLTIDGVQSGNGVITITY